MTAVLFGREHEQAELLGHLDRARDGAGSVVVVEAPPGLGKTALLDWFAINAEPSAVVRRATASQIEGRLTFGVVRQLFSADADQPHLPGSLRSVLRGGVGEQRVVADPATVWFGLEQLAVDLAADAPLVLLVDDVQWSDGSSLEALAFLARRVVEAPILLVAARRPNEARGTDAILGDLALLAATTVRLRPLGPEPSRKLIAAEFGTEPDAAFVDACDQATGGNPLYLVELCRDLAESGNMPDSAAAVTVPRSRPDTVSRRVLLRLGRLGDEARRVAWAVAVLGDGAELRHVAALAELDLTATATAVDRLAEASLLAPGLPPRFAHPLLRAVVEDDHPPASRAAAHGRAADLLLADGTDPERVAAHLLRAPALGNGDHRAALESAASAARERGGAGAAAEYLERALAEVTDRAERARVLASLGSARLAAGMRGADALLVEAIELTDDPELATYARSVLADALSTEGRYEEAMRVLEQAAHHSEASAKVQADLAMSLLVYGAASYEMERALPLVARILSNADESSPSGRRILFARSATAALSYAPIETWLPDLERFVDEVVEITTREHAGLLVLVINGLLRNFLLDLADSVVARWLAATEKAGTPFDVMNANGAAAMAAFYRGSVLLVETHAAVAEGIARHAGWTDPTATSLLVTALVEQQRLDEAEEVVARYQADTDELLRSTSGTLLLGARGRLRLALGQADLAADDLVAGYERLPSAIFRPLAIEALLMCGRRDQAAAMAEDGLRRAESAPPLQRSLARRELAVISPPEDAVTILREVVADLEQTPMQLELARTAFLLGQALRRVRRPREAREPLARALDLAHGLGAWQLESRARQELLAAGARPRRASRTGVMALTASERRVASLAADGRSNPEIAGALFISRKSVESHLSHVYQKLGITGRPELADALAGDAARP